MLERLRFVRYALAFERAFRTDRWDRVAACFHPDGRYVIEGSDTELDGETFGPTAICEVFKQMLDTYDRRFDNRSPGLASLPRVRDGVLQFDWKVRYAIGGDSMVLHGRCACRFDGGKIIELRDTMLSADECRRWAELARAA